MPGTAAGRDGYSMSGCYVYMVAASDGSIYTGTANDPQRRVSEHNCGKRGAKALRGKRPVRLLWCTACENRSFALQLEAEIKRLRPSEKWSLVLSNSSDG